MPGREARTGGHILDVVEVFVVLRGAGRAPLDVELVVEVADGLAGSVVHQELGGVEGGVVGAGQTSRSTPTRSAAAVLENVKKQFFNLAG